MAAQRAAGSPRRGGWRIVPRPINEHGDLVYDVFFGATRRAWGLKDEDTARRWLKRLAPSAPPALLEPERAGDADDDATDKPTTGAPDEETDPESIVPRRVWWNEA
jgi:hypothetical protein